MPKQEKITAVAEMKKLFDEADSFFVTDYQGLNVADVTVLRRNLRTQNVTFLVAKNTLLKLAAHQAGVTGIDKHLNGPTAIAFCADDPVATAKVLQDMFKEKDRPRTKVFVVADSVYEADKLKAFAELPSREQLLSMVAAAVEAPLVQLVGTIDGFFRKLMGSIDALADKRQSEGAGAGEQQ